MLRREAAGGGVLLNLGVHGFDLCRFITGEEPEIVSAIVSNAVFGLDVEDYATVTLRTQSGIVFQNEVGYTYPTTAGRDDERKLAASEMLVRDGDGGFTKVTASGEVFVPQPQGFLSMWEGVVADCLDRVRHGEPPPTSPEDTARAVSLVFEAYDRAAPLS
jgi:predicted dehydrogenase